MDISEIYRIETISLELSLLNIEYQTKKKPLNEEKESVYKKIKKEFISHPQWEMFIQRHGVKDFESDKDCYGRINEDLHFTFDFVSKTCFIIIQRWWHDECEYDEHTRFFKISELIEFLNNHHYYDALIERAKSIEKTCEENRKNEEHDAEYAKYLELKAKYESKV